MFKMLINLSNYLLDAILVDVKKWNISIYRLLQLFSISPPHCAPCWMFFLCHLAKLFIGRNCHSIDFFIPPVITSPSCFWWFPFCCNRSWWWYPFDSFIYHSWETWKLLFDSVKYFDASISSCHQALKNLSLSQYCLKKSRKFSPHYYDK